MSERMMMKGRIIDLFKRTRKCAFCQCSIEHKRQGAIYCGHNCQQKAYKVRKEKKKRAESIRTVIDEVKVNYPRLTFRLSVVGFITSIAFYVGVLHDLMTEPVTEQQKIEQLKLEKQHLEDQLEVITNQLDEKK